MKYFFSFINIIKKFNKLLISAKYKVDENVHTPTNYQN